jgi:hypothetical protein
MFDLTDLILTATLSIALSGICWTLGFYLASRRSRHLYTVVVYLPERSSEPTVHWVDHCGNPREALIKAAAEKLGCSLSDASNHVDLYPYYAWVFGGKQFVTEY